MAGILANSASVTMTAGDPDAVNDGYVTNEAITLSTLPAAGSYVWGLAKPQGASDRSDLSSTIDATPTFVPDTHGVWVVYCTVDGVTAYVLRLTVEAVAVTTHGDASRYIPIANSTVPAPALGGTVFFSRALEKLAIKNTDGSVEILQSTNADTTLLYSSLVLTGAEGETGTLLVRTFEQAGDPPGLDNTIMSFGAHMAPDNTDPIDAALPMVRVGVESSYWTGATYQSEGHLELAYDPLADPPSSAQRYRPYSFRHDLITRVTDVLLNGHVNIATHDGVNTIFRFDVGTERLNVDPTAQIATNTGDPVLVRGLEISGANPIIPWRYLSAGVVPTLEPGELAYWYNPVGQQTWLVVRDPNSSLGYRGIQLLPIP